MKAIEKLTQDFILIDRERHRKNTRRGMVRAKKEGRLLGRPCTFTSEQVLEILSLLDDGYSYRDVASRYGVSHTAIAQIKKDGLEKISRIDLQHGKKKRTLNNDNPEVLLDIPLYTKRLQDVLENNHNIKLTTKECYILITKILDPDRKEKEKRSKYEYSPPSPYIELTSHVWSNQ